VVVAAVPNKIVCWCVIGLQRGLRIQESSEPGAPGFSQATLDIVPDECQAKRIQHELS